MSDCFRGELRWMPCSGVLEQGDGSRRSRFSNAATRAHEGQSRGSEMAVTAERSPITVDEVSIVLPARDNYTLGGTLYAALEPQDATDAIVFNGGGGLTYERYRHFLRYLAAEGLPVLAFDYRGVGRSSPRNRRTFDAGIEDWSEQDEAAAIDYARQVFPKARLSSISHSIGCMVSAGAPNADVFQQMVFVAPHTAYWGDYRQPWRVPMAMVWHVLMPLVAQTFGYFPASRLGLGDDFPRRMALQWAGRTGPYFRFGAYGGQAIREYQLIDRLQRLCNTALVIACDDDAFSTDRAIRRFLMNMPNLRMIRRELASHGNTLGHFGFFRRRSQAHWRAVTHFIRNAESSYKIAPDWAVD